MSEPSSRYRAFAHPAVDELKRKSVRGGVVAVSAQGAKFVLQIATMVLLARLLSAEDFGLQGMAVVLTGFLGLFKDAGLSAATIQRLEVTQAQISTLFWINVVVGAALATFTAVLAPVLVAFYGEPRLYWITVVLGVAFVFSGLGAQHQALIVREMRFVTLAKIELLSLTISSAAGVVMALFGWRYWALVSMVVVGSIVSAAGAWLANPWVPGLPRRKCGVRSMLHFGWVATCNNLVVFLAWNSDNILLGRFWGADALGLYGRAYQLATLPVHQLNGAITGVAFSAFSRIQDDADRLARSFLTAYSLLVSLTIPITISCALFAEEIVGVVLGAKWMEAAPIFRLLAPTALVFALVNPLSWLVISTGRVRRALTMTAATTPLVIVGIVLGLSQGPKGVALGYTLAMALLVIPITAWSIHGTRVTWAGLWRAIKPPLLSGLVASAIGLIVKITLGGMLASIPFLLVGLGLVLGSYAWVLLVAMGQKNLYVDLLTQVFRGARSGGSLIRGATPVFVPRSARMSQSTLARMSQSRFLRKYLGHPYLLMNIWIWNHLPASSASWRPVRGYGCHLHRLTQLRATRRQSVGTFFFRNRPELELLIRLLDQKRQGSTLNVTILACSKGAEVYSISYTIRCARMDLKVRLCALDISTDILEFAETGVYSLKSHDGSGAPSPGSLALAEDVVASTSRDQPSSIFERMSCGEMKAMFDREGDQVRVKPRFREGISWHLGDAGDPGLVGALGLQDIVVANRFLCHMHPEKAEECLRNLTQLVKPGGYLFVSGVDLGVRSKVARELGWRPVTELIREIHEGDPSLRRDWPLQYWGLEPFDQGRIDWKMRYASVFQRGDGP
jgi:O-antigen/teichoic acid export membrane protein/chemotaxis methyl-accepting protein methylase